ncbi:MAG: DNA gyrase subunit A, partial [Pseudohongiellaceae bacterium]
EGERITSMLPVSEYLDDKYIFMATSNGTVKKTALIDFSRQRSVGLRAIELDDGDELVGTAVTDGSRDIMLVSSSGKTIRFKESDVRAMGRTARGVRGIKMADGYSMISLIVPEEGKQILSVSENGYGKRTSSEDFPIYGRGGQGVIGMQTSDRNGAVVGAVQVSESDEIMLISDKGTLVRTRVVEVSVQGRNTQGVRLIRLKEGEKLVGLEQVDEPEEVELLIEAEGADIGESAEIVESTDAVESADIVEPEAKIEGSEPDGSETD